MDEGDEDRDAGGDDEEEGEGSDFDLDLGDAGSDEGLDHSYSCFVILNTCPDFFDAFRCLL